MPDSKVDITTTPRGFHIYGPPIPLEHDGDIRIYESSNAMGPHVWMALHTDTVELTPDSARAIVGALQTWLDEIPSRWEVQR